MEHSSWKASQSAHSKGEQKESLENHRLMGDSTFIRKKRSTTSFEIEEIELVSCRNGNKSLKIFYVASVSSCVKYKNDYLLYSFEVILQV